jgi:hypothetical protein
MKTGATVSPFERKSQVRKRPLPTFMSFFVLNGGRDTKERMAPLLDTLRFFFYHFSF